MKVDHIPLILQFLKYTVTEEGHLFVSTFTFAGYFVDQRSPQSKQIFLLLGIQIVLSKTILFI
jgi:hypothetical protein